MIASRINFGVVVGLLVFFALPVGAQTPEAQPSADQIPTDGRDASFLPPVQLAPASVPASQPAAAQPNSTPANPPPVLSLPPPTAATTSTSAAPPPIVPEKPLELDKPVESSALRNIDPDAIGLLSPEDGGLGAAMWKGTPRELVERLLPALTLPTSSPALNGLAQRFLLTTANVPEGTAGSGPSLTSIRVDRLVTLGDATDAWKLVLLAKPGQIDEITLRLAVEAALVSEESKDVCAKLPTIIQAHNSPEWQKSLIVCQLRDGDTKAAQLGLEVLHTQDVKDDTFFQLVEHNIIAGTKPLPRQLTPLRPITLALLRLIDRPLPSEIYAHPDAAIIPELLQTKTHDDGVRLALAEHAAARGIIDGAQLADVYRSAVFTPDELAGALNGPETGAPQRALLYQAALAEKTPQKRLDEAVKFMQSLEDGAFNPAAAQILVDMTGSPPATSELIASAPAAAHIFIMANKPKEALAWLKLARQAAVTSPDAAAQLQAFWPLAVLTGLETDSDYGQTFGTWLNAALKDADHARREQIGGVLLLLDAAGFAVPEDAWAHVADLSAGERHATPLPALLLERLRMAGVANRRGEAVLLALALDGSGTSQSSLMPAVETIRALRLVGLTSDALALARETASMLLASSEAAVKH